MKSLHVVYLLFISTVAASCNSGSSSGFDYKNRIYLDVSGLTDLTETGGIDVVLYDGSASADILKITQDAKYSFIATIEYDHDYSIILNNVSSSNVCALDGPSGVMPDEALTIALVCSASDPTHKISGSISGLDEGEKITLAINSGYTEQFLAPGAFTLNSILPNNFGYEVSVSDHPSGKFCAVENGEGTISEAVDNVIITCSLTNYLFNAGDHNGNLGGRSGADSICTGAATRQSSRIAGRI